MILYGLVEESGVRKRKARGRLPRASLNFELWSPKMLEEPSILRYPPYSWLIAPSRPVFSVSSICGCSRNGNTRTGAPGVCSFL